MLCIYYNLYVNVTVSFIFFANTISGLPHEVCVCQKYTFSVRQDFLASQGKCLNKRLGKTAFNCSFLIRQLLITLLTHHLKSCPLVIVSLHVQPCYHKL